MCLFAFHAENLQFEVIENPPQFSDWRIGAAKGSTGRISAPALTSGHQRPLTSSSVPRNGPSAPRNEVPCSSEELPTQPPGRRPGSSAAKAEGRKSATRVVSKNQRPSKFSELRRMPAILKVRIAPDRQAICLCSLLCPLYGMMVPCSESNDEYVLVENGDVTVTRHFACATYQQHYSDVIGAPATTGQLAAIRFLHSNMATTSLENCRYTCTNDRAKRAVARTIHDFFEPRRKTELLKQQKPRASEAKFQLLRGRASINMPD